ncbi:MAG: hypothetical protein AAGA77_15790 [Bacteroidota bacterium]
MQGKNKNEPKTQSNSNLHPDEKFELSKFYSAERDAQLKQLMSLNGQGTFSVLAILAGLLAGGSSLQYGEIFFFYIPRNLFLLGIGTLLLLIAAIIFAFEHTRRLKKLEKLIKNPQRIENVAEDLFVIRPNPIGNYLIFIGLFILIIGVMAMLALIISSNG